MSDRGRPPDSSPDARFGHRSPGKVTDVSEAEQGPDVAQRLAEDLEPGRHRAPSEGVPQDLPDDADDADAEDGHAT